jgi:hypothetical protein
MNDEKSISWKKLQEKWLTRRNLIRGAAGTAAGAGLLLGSGMRLPALAEGHDEGERRKCRTLPRPLPHITTPPGQHFNFPGPVTEGDPSTVTDFHGMIGQADLFFAGTGTDLHSSQSAPYGFHTDWRFMAGEFVGVDGLHHKGTLSFI